MPSVPARSESATKWPQKASFATHTRRRSSELMSAWITWKDTKSVRYLKCLHMVPLMTMSTSARHQLKVAIEPWNSLL